MIAFAYLFISPKAAHCRSIFQFDWQPFDSVYKSCQCSAFGFWSIFHSLKYAGFAECDPVEETQTMKSNDKQQIVKIKLIRIKNKTKVQHC